MLGLVWCSVACSCAGYRRASWAWAGASLVARGYALGSLRGGGRSLGRGLVGFGCRFAGLVAYCVVSVQRLGGVGMSAVYTSFLASLRPGAPVVCFGPRSVPPAVLAVASSVGASVARSGRPVFSGGARGCDSSFVSGARSASGSVSVFRPLPGSGVSGLFARSERALSGALALGGAAVVFVPASAFAAIAGGHGCRGGSAWSARCALRLGLPLLLVGFGVVAGQLQWCSHFYSGSKQFKSEHHEIAKTTPNVTAKCKDAHVSIAKAITFISACGFMYCLLTEVCNV